MWGKFEDVPLSICLEDIRPLILNSQGRRPLTHTSMHRSHLTLLLYLSAVERGGETIFHSGATKRSMREVLSVKPEPGLALLHEQGEGTGL